MQLQRRRFRKQLLAVSSIAVAVGSSLYGAATLWVGVNNSWDNGANWSPTNAEPGAASDVTFPAPLPGAGGLVQLTAGELANSLTFNQAYSLTGGDLSLTAGTVTVAPAFTATIATSLLGAAGVAKLGGGTLVLSGSNAYGGTTVPISASMRCA